MKQVYNPDDEDRLFWLGGQDYLLPAGSVSELPDEVAEHAASTLGMWGICILAGPEDKAKADAVNKAATRAWCRAEVKELAEQQKAFDGLGVKITPSADQAYAVKWLKENGA